MARRTSKTAPEISSYPVYTKMTMVFSSVIVIFYLMLNADIQKMKSITELFRDAPEPRWIFFRIKI
jgi:hypothetical protein